MRVSRVPDEVTNPLESHPVFRPNPVFTIRWQSAKTVRKALAHFCQLARWPFTGAAERGKTNRKLVPRLVPQGIDGFEFCGIRF
jgi:hypothetical protein